MTDYLIDSNFHLVLPLQKITSENDLLFQQVRLLLHTWETDFVYDVTTGMPYEQSILGIGSVDATELEVIYYNKLSKLQYFKTMENFKIETTSKRELLISFDVISLNGVSQNFYQVV